ncbi:MAG TPA: glycosyltransferase, partial [Bryobacteraceae bacterium]|nr:glycosyltransferase [Bryobacteraceae bacterium]
EGEVKSEPLDALRGAETILVSRTGGYSKDKIARGLLGPMPISVLNYQSAAMAEELTRLLEENSFDIVQMEGVHLFAYLDILRNARKPVRLVCDWHNIESELMARYAEQSDSTLRRLYARRTAKLLRRLEDKLLESCDAHVVCSEREKQLLLARQPAARIEAVGNGVDVEHHSDEAIDEACREFPHLGSPGARTKVVFVGSMDYHANIDAALYFAREIWPAVRQARQDLEFLVVGSRPVPEVVALGQMPGIRVTGTVEDVRPFYRCASAVVVPARIGSGTRLKALEAMAAGVPVISTTLGVEGLDVTPGRDVVLADSEADFAAAVLRLREGTPEWRQLSEGGRRLVKERYDWAFLGKTLRALYAEQLAGATA